MSRTGLTIALLAVVAAALLWFGAQWPAERRSTNEPPLPGCTLPPGQSLSIACSADCGFFNTQALNRAAGALDYRIDLIPSLLRRPTLAAETLDGILIPGGEDIDPQYYTGGLPEALRQRIAELDHLIEYSERGSLRDAHEYALLQSYFQREAFSDTPVLGICRGMQMLGASQGLPLYADIGAELGLNISRAHVDRVALSDPQSTLAPWLGSRPFTAVQYHHQALHYAYYLEHRAQFPQFNVTALSHDDSIIEIIEFSDRPAIGTQFHPEYSPSRSRKALFRWFLTRACLKKRTGT